MHAAGAISVVEGAEANSKLLLFQAPPDFEAVEEEAEAKKKHAHNSVPNLTR
jgi:hypothetical protein